MRFQMRFVLILAAVFAGCSFSLLTQSTQAQSTPAAPAAKHGMVLDDLAKLVRVGAPRLSPDGARIA